MIIEQSISLNKISVKEAMQQIDDSGKKILFIVDEKNLLVGSITDGDIRRWILKNGNITDNVSLAMNPSPFFLYENQRQDAEALMEKRAISAVPIVTGEGEIIQIIFAKGRSIAVSCTDQNLEVAVVIMAGGKGSRLYPYTKILPKPLIPIGDTPITERIIGRFVSYGCRKFFLTVNYKKNMIKSYFNELEKDYQIEYIDEEKPLGTAGSLFLLKDQLKETFFMSNCDILIEADYRDLLGYHKKSNNAITLVTSLKTYTVPYGVVDLQQDGAVGDIREKPELDYLVNTGMYVMEPWILDKIPKDTFFHMTDLLEVCLKEKIRVGAYPISEASWLDMGQFSEMNIMLEKLGIK